MRTGRKIAAGVCVSGMLIMCIAVSVFASPSISNIHDSKEVIISPKSTDGTNTASLLSLVDVYTNEAISDQYKVKDKDGNLVSTDMSNMIDAATSIVTETDENGKSIVESIPAVTDILANISEKTPDEFEKEYGYNPENLDQLTYMMDFKYTSTDYRVIAGEDITVDNEMKTLDNGMIQASVRGGEILRSASIDNYVIIQVDTVTQKIFFFKMNEYDEETGNYAADFPCVGPYMITNLKK